MTGMEGALDVTVSGSTALGLAVVSRLVKAMPGDLLKSCADPAVVKL
jgi:hypothetical protein